MVESFSRERDRVTAPLFLELINDRPPIERRMWKNAEWIHESWRDLYYSDEVESRRGGKKKVKEKIEQITYLNLL